MPSRSCISPTSYRISGSKTLPLRITAHARGRHAPGGKARHLAGKRLHDLDVEKLHHGALEHVDARAEIHSLVDAPGGKRHGLLDECLPARGFRWTETGRGDAYETSSLGAA